MKSLNERISDLSLEVDEDIKNLAWLTHPPKTTLQVSFEIIKELQEERDRFKHLWETDSAQSKEIIAELERKLITG